MPSSSVPVFPINNLSFVVDRSITNVFDVANHLESFEGLVQSVVVEGDTIEGPQTVYFLAPLPEDANSDIKLYKFSIGPVEVSISYNTKTQGLVLEVFLTIPILGTVLIGSATGSLKEGVSIKVGYGSILAGELGIKIDKGSAYLFYSFTAFGKKFSGQVKIF